MQPITAAALELRGTVTECTDDPAPVCAKYVYQRVAPGAGNIAGDPTRSHQRRRYVIPADPRTVPQLARRHLFKLAVIAYHVTPEAYDAEARRIQVARHLPYYHAWLSAYLKNPPPPVGILWDSGGTLWDDGNTVWDAGP